MAESTLRVAQLNMGSLLEPDWDARRHEIVAWIRRLAPDVVCLEEVWEGPTGENTAGWIADATDEFGWHWRYGGSPFGGELGVGVDVSFGSAVLSRWPIDEHSYHRLPTVEDPDDTFVHNVPWELLHVSTVGLDIFACHLSSAPTHGLHRRAQVVEIVGIIDDVRAGKADRVTAGERRTIMPPILCGDFNAEPDSDEIRFLSSLTPLEGRTAFFQDAWRVAGDGPGYTQDWRTNRLAERMNLHRKRIDYIFVGDPFLRRRSAGRVLSVDLAFHEPLTGIGASDHFGLVADIVWPDRPV